MKKCRMRQASSLLEHQHLCLLRVSRGDIAIRFLLAVPIYRSFKAAESGNENEMVSALETWGTLGILALGESVISADLRRSKLYPHAKLALLAWLLWGGSSTLWR